jgi:hypothetical protein
MQTHEVVLSCILHCIGCEITLMHAASLRGVATHKAVDLDTLVRWTDLQTTLT